MAIVDLVMPKMGESIMEATILKWHKKIGEYIKQDEIVLDIATDKVDSEIPSSVEGVVKEIFFNVNDVVPIGTVLAKIETGAVAEQKPAAPVAVAVPVAPVKEEEVVPVAAQVVNTAVQEAKTEFVPYTPQPSANKMPNNNRFFSPLVLNIANSEGLSLSELENVPGTGAENRVTKKDILQYIADKKEGKIQPVAPVPAYQQYVAPTPVAAPVIEEPVHHATIVPAFVEPVAVAAATIAATEVVEHVVAKHHEEHIDTSAFIKQEVALPVAETKIEDEVVEPSAFQEEEVHQAYKTNDVPVAIPVVAPIAEIPTQHSIEEEAYVSPAVQTVHTTPINVHSEEVYVAPVAAPAPAPVSSAKVNEAKAQEAYRISYEEHQKETAVHPIAHQENINIPPIQNIVMPEVVPADKPSVEIIEMDRMRKLIAKHMVDSKHTSPHVTSFAEADVTNMVQWRERVKGDFEKREGIKLTYTPMFIECILKVLKRYPLINSSVDGDKIIIKNFFNIGFATSLPSGNLIVPVIKDAQNHNLVSLTRSVSTLAENARNNKLKPDDTSGGTFTFSNLGNFGSLMGTPIINQPQSAIMAVGAIKKRPVVIETDKGDFIGIRQMMYLSLSYDHRIIDGSIGASFLTEVAKEFENWNTDRELKYVVKEWYVE